MNRETSSAIVSHVARVILDADRPLTRNELFPADPMVYGCRVITSSWKDKIIRSFVRLGEIDEVHRKGEVLYVVKKRRSLEELAMPREEVCHVDAEVDEAMFKLSKMRALEHRARVEVALRALRRLLVSKGPQARPALFILKRGDKYVEKVALDSRWQVDLLERLADEDLIDVEDDEGTHTLYSVVDHGAIQKIVEGGENPCIHTLLWPGMPCTVPHGSVLDLPPVSAQSVEAAEHRLDEIDPGPSPVFEASPVDRVLVDTLSSAETDDFVDEALRRAQRPPPFEQASIVRENELDSPILLPSRMPDPPRSAVEVYELEGQDAERIAAIEDAIRKLVREAGSRDLSIEEEARACSLSRYELFPDAQVEDERWQREALKKFVHAGVVVRFGERSDTRYSAREELRERVGDHGWLMRLLMPAALNRYAVTQALRETGVHTAASEPPQPSASATVLVDTESGEELKDLMKEVGRLLPEFFEVLKYQHDRIESMEKEMKLMRAVNAKLDAVIAALGVQVDDPKDEVDVHAG